MLPGGRPKGGLQAYPGLSAESSGPQEPPFRRCPEFAEYLASKAPRAPAGRGLPPPPLPLPPPLPAVPLPLSPSPPPPPPSSLSPGCSIRRKPAATHALDTLLLLMACGTLPSMTFLCVPQAQFARGKELMDGQQAMAHTVQNSIVQYSTLSIVEYRV